MFRDTRDERQYKGGYRSLGSTTGRSGIPRHWFPPTPWVSARNPTHMYQTPTNPQQFLNDKSRQLKTVTEQKRVPVPRTDNRKSRIVNRLRVFTNDLLQKTPYRWTWLLLLSHCWGETLLVSSSEGIHTHSPMAEISAVRLNDTVLTKKWRGRPPQRRNSQRGTKVETERRSPGCKGPKTTWHRVSDKTFLSSYYFRLYFLPGLL